MSAFCVDTITHEANLRPEHGVLRDASLAVTSDARLAANRIVESARAEAHMLLQQAHAEAQRLAQEAEQQTLQRADQLLKALEHANATFLLRAQDTIVELATGLFDRLMMDATPRERIEAALRRVLHEAPPKLVEPLLRVHPDDAELVPAVEWAVKPDPSLTRGTCRLEASDGEWCADFSAAILALKSAFARAVEEPDAGVEGS
jgi:flagellar biosynthesis/type III secretory pathway protein FliH